MFASLSFAVSFAIVGGCKCCSDNYSEIYNDPRVIDAVANFDGYSLKGKQNMPDLAGNWEFFTTSGL